MKRPETPYAAAVRLLSMKAMSAAELRDGLVRRGCSAEDAEAAVARVSELGFIDENAYAEALVRRYTARGYGPRALPARLRQHGLSAETIAAAMQTLPDRDGEELDAMVRKYLRGENTEASRARAGAALARSEYGVTDPEVLDAIRWHTTGHAGMTLLAKVVFLADAIEPYRKPYPGIEKIRRLARKGLDEAVCQSARETQKHVAARSLPLNPNTAAMLAELDHKKGEGTK